MAPVRPRGAGGPGGCDLDCFAAEHVCSRYSLFWSFLPVLPFLPVLYTLSLSTASQIRARIRTPLHSSCRLHLQVIPLAFKPQITLSVVLRHPHHLSIRTAPQHSARLHSIHHGSICYNLTTLITATNLIRDAVTQCKPHA